MHLYAAKKGSRETWGRFRIIITHAAQSLLTHSRETANCSADVPAHLFLAPLDRRDGEGSIPYFSLAKLRITNATHSFPSAILQSLWQLLGRQILKPITLHSLVWELSEVQST